VTINASETISIEGMEGEAAREDLSSTADLNTGIYSSVGENGVGNAGEIEITTASLTITSQGEIGSFVFGQGNGGDVNITADSLSVNSGSEISASNTRRGNSGSVAVTANNLNLDNSTISATNQPSAATEEPQQGGNINLSIAKNIVLFNNSTISAQAFGNANGGNVDIDTNFVIAYPSKATGNDIIASAEAGKGGNIEINAEGIFNIEASNGATDRDGNLVNNGNNDIDASSDVNGLDGKVTINTPDNNPLREDLEQAQNVVTSIVETTDACSVSETGEIETSGGLVVKGKGGVPPEPTEPLNAETIVVDRETASNVSQNNNKSIPSHIQPVAYRDNGEPIYLARGIILQENGEIILTAYPTQNTQSRTPQPSSGCD
jgi:large exoprotein involved in heme utilization and adhesion